ncbi:MAG: alpha-xylosidase, partial [Rhodoluna sp.]
MKFTNGFWLMREGFSATYALQAHSASVTKDDRRTKLAVTAATKRINHRGDTLNAATLGLEFDAPANDVIRVRLSHHKGAKPALTFPVTESSAMVSASADEGWAQLTSGALQVRASMGDDWNLE